MDKIIERVGITIHTTDGQCKEILLEPWQLEPLTFIFGLQVRVPNLDDFQFSPNDILQERMALYKKAIKEMNEKNR